MLNNFLSFFLILIVSLNISCSKDEKKISKLQENNLDLQVLEAYKEGMKSLNEGDVLYAAKKFNEVEILFPQSKWAPKSSIMAAYSYYKQDYYNDAIAELERFLKVYPNHKNTDYVYYLMALCHFEQIVDEKKDLNSISNAKKNFEYLINNFPNTEYSLDAEFKLDLIDDILASKEMYIGRYYLEKKKWIPAINRFRNVVDEYDATIYTEEALHRLVEIYYIIGLESEAKKYANLLGYNYQSSEWYAKTYVLFNINYQKILKDKTNKQTKKHKIKDWLKSLINIDE